MQKAVKHNISEKFSWQAKRLVSADFEKASLCIDLGSDSLNLAIFSSDKEALAIKSLQNKQFSLQPNAIESYFNEEPLLQNNFARVFISLQSIQYTLVPKAFYKEEDKEIFLKFNCGNKKNTSVFVDEINRMDAKVIYAMDSDLKKNIDTLFPNHHTKAGVSLLIDHSFADKSQKETALLHFKKDAVDLVLSREQPVYCNSFSVLSPEDLLYFVLASFEQHKFNPAAIKLIITGETETNSLAVKLLKKYIKQISFAIIDKQFSKPLEVTGMPSHYYYHLLNRIHCE